MDELQKMETIRKKMRKLYPQLLEARKRVKEIEDRYALLSDEYHRLDRALAERKKKTILPLRGEPRRSSTRKAMSLIEKIRSLIRMDKRIWPKIS